MPKGIPNPKPPMTDEEKAARDLVEASQVLKDQAKALDLAIDPEWDTDTLAVKVLEAQEAAAEADKAAFEAARKVPVFLLRDAWPVADERHNAGETIDVTEEIAEKWYEAGVARPGKKPA
jgi:hypothetical protein